MLIRICMKLKGVAGIGLLDVKIRDNAPAVLHRQVHFSLSAA
ncbi:hypothetical protein [Petroclostridium xylanilyticum]|nr:hypothetical protein [Petroclostridium xylanilyticum]